MKLLSPPEAVAVKLPSAHKLAFTGTTLSVIVGAIVIDSIVETQP